MMHIRDAKALWDHLNNTYGTSDAGKELYIIMVSFHDYKMVANKSTVEQAHEIRRLVKELELLKYVIPDEVVTGCIIAKLPSPWRNFATSLKRKRVKITFQNLIQSLDDEEKARAKDNTKKGTRNIVPILSRKISGARTKERGNNNLSMPKQLLPLRRRRKTSLSHLFFQRKPSANLYACQDQVSCI
jgi:hypothetical protein